MPEPEHTKVNCAQRRWLPGTITVTTGKKQQHIPSDRSRLGQRTPSLTHSENSFRQSFYSSSYIILPLQGFFYLCAAPVTLLS